MSERLSASDTLESGSISTSQWIDTKKEKRVCQLLLLSPDSWLSVFFTTANTIALFTTLTPTDWQIVHVYINWKAFCCYSSRDLFFYRGSILFAGGLLLLLGDLLLLLSNLLMLLGDSFFLLWDLLLQSGYLLMLLGVCLFIIYSSSWCVSVNYCPFGVIKMTTAFHPTTSSFMKLAKLAYNFLTTMAS